MPASQIESERDPRDLPAYGIADAARYLDVPAATLRSWVAGRTYPRQHGVGTGVLVQRIDAGESIADLGADYGLSEARIKAAVLFERAA